MSYLEINHPAADPELHAPDFVEAVTRFRAAVKEFTASVNKLDDSIAAAITSATTLYKHFESEEANDDIPIPEGYHPPA
jgi:hypothetical protein